MGESLYLVEKEDFKALTERLIVEKVRTERIEERTSTIVKVFGIESNDCICSHKWYNDDTIPDEYYIFKLPENDEWGPAIPKRKVELTDEETKLLFEELAAYMKEKANDGTV